MPIFDNNPESRDRIDAAVGRALYAFPYSAALLLRIPLIAVPSVETMGVTAKGKLYYNPDFALHGLERDDGTRMGLSLDECALILMHEALHLYFRHADRLGGRLHEVFNQAGDTEINVNLYRVKLKDGTILNFPSWGWFPWSDKYPEDTPIDLTAEEYYDLLEKNDPKPPTPPPTERDPWQPPEPPPDGET